MDNLESYFTEENIIKLLCKYRANEANKRHAKHMIRNVSLNKTTNKISVTDDQHNFKFLQKLFPSRRQWKKLNERERKIYKDTLSVNRRRLYKSYELTKNEIIQKGSSAPEWYILLMNFVREIKSDIHDIETSEFKLTKPEILGIKKEKEKDVIIYRPIALYNFKDKIICSLTTRYLVLYFESIFNELNCSYAFRPPNSKGKVPDHHDCIQDILNYKNSFPKLWVSECDIQKFFDTVQHNHILEVLDRYSKEVQKKNGLALDVSAIKIFNLFLESFNFQESILNLDSEWFQSKNLAFGKFKWVESKLNTEFGPDYTQKYKIGVPQGNAISCFIANLILHDVDVKIKQYDPDIFYIRYCDDMVLMSPDEQKCSEALKIYMQSIQDNFLLYHRPEKFVNYKNTEISQGFWKSKSKKPFYWGDKNRNENNIPWLSFVGYQIDFHKRIRVRKVTLKKETKKQIFETQKVIKALGKLHRKLEVENELSRLSKNQIAFRTQQRLIAMSVGRVSIHNHRKPLEQGFCWTNGFKKLKKNRISSKQLRYLDKRRNIQLRRINKELSRVTKESENVNFPDKLKNIHFGGAYSYYNFLRYK